MPVELRRIIFTQEELCIALATLQRSDGKGLPQGDIAALKIGEDGSLLISITVPGSDQPSKKTLSAEQMSNLLIRFCVQNKIPLPREGEKSSVVHENGVALLVKSGDLEAEAADALARLNG